MRLRFEGHSDDTFGEYESTNEDYDNCANGKPIPFYVTSPEGDGMLVVGQYCPGKATGWQIGVASSQDDENDTKPIPTWPMHFERGAYPHTPALIIEAPEGTTVRCALARDDDD